MKLIRRRQINDRLKGMDIIPIGFIIETGIGVGRSICDLLNPAKLIIATDYIDVK
jgi:hypothetical protein